MKLMAIAESSQARGCGRKSKIATPFRKVMAAMRMKSRNLRGEAELIVHKALLAAFDARTPLSEAPASRHLTRKPELSLMVPFTTTTL